MIRDSCEESKVDSLKSKVKRSIEAGLRLGGGSGIQLSTINFRLSTSAVPPTVFRRERITDHGSRSTCLTCGRGWLSVEARAPGHHLRAAWSRTCGRGTIPAARLS